MDLILRSCDFTADGCVDEDCEYCNSGRWEGQQLRKQEAEQRKLIRAVKVSYWQLGWAMGVIAGFLAGWLLT